MGLIQRDAPYPHWEFTAPADPGPGRLADRLLVVPERGGLITGWRCNGVERLYLDEQRFADPSLSVRGGIPVLFPICGSLPGDRLTLPSGAGCGTTSYPMAQHGFARDLPSQLDPLAAGRGLALSFSDSGERRLELALGAAVTLQCRYRVSDAVA